MLSPTSGSCPFRGEYFELLEERRELVRGLIYPVPDPEFPFLGVHLTRGMDGTVEAGPNAVLALKREGYERTSFSFADTISTLSFSGFWRMAAKNWRVAIQEMSRSGSRRKFAESLQRFVPEIRAADLGKPGAGVRAQGPGPHRQARRRFPHHRERANDACPQRSVTRRNRLAVDRRDDRCPRDGKLPGGLSGATHPPIPGYRKPRRGFRPLECAG